MAKRTLATTLKGTLDIDFDLGTAIVTEITKDSEHTYDLFKILEEYNGQHVTISIKQDDEIEPVSVDIFV